MIETRRQFLKRTLILGGTLVLRTNAFAKIPSFRERTKGVHCTMYRSVNGSPEKNLMKVIELIGGIEKVIGTDDVVVIKPNVQWWNQGGPNLSALNAFVYLIMNRPGGFNGEVVIAENCHRGSTPWGSAGWARRFERNSDPKPANFKRPFRFGTINV